MTNIFKSFLITAHPNNYLRVVWIVEFFSGRRLTSLDEENLVALDLLCCEPSLYASEDIVAAAIFRHLILIPVCIRATVVIAIEWFIIS